VLDEDQQLRLKQLFSSQDNDVSKLSMGSYLNDRQQQFINAERFSAVSDDSNQVSASFSQLTPPQISLPQKIIIKMKERKQQMQQKQKMVKEVVNS